MARIFSFLFPVIFLLISLGQAAIFYFGGRQIIQGTLTLGEWQKFSMYLMYVFFPLGQLGFIISQMSQAGASSKRIFEILDAQSDVVDLPDARTLPEIQGNGRVPRRDLPLLSATASRRSRKSASASSPARRWPCWAPPARARPRSST